MEDNFAEQLMILENRDNFEKELEKKNLEAYYLEVDKDIIRECFQDKKNEKEKLIK